MFTACTSDELKGFIIARELKDVPKALSTQIVPKLKPGRIKKAFNVREIPVILSDSSPNTCESEIDNQQVEDNVESDNDDEGIIDLSTNDCLPSFWLQNIS